MFEIRSTIVPHLGAPISFTALVDTADGATLIEAALHCAYGYSAIVITEVSELSPTSYKDDGAFCAKAWCNCPSCSASRSLEVG